jgi:hypothetical protein
MAAIASTALNRKQGLNLRLILATPMKFVRAGAVIENGLCPDRIRQRLRKPIPSRLRRFDKDDSILIKMKAAGCGFITASGQPTRTLGETLV